VGKGIGVIISTRISMSNTICNNVDVTYSFIKYGTIHLECNKYYNVTYADFTKSKNNSTIETHLITKSLVFIGSSNITIPNTGLYGKEQIVRVGSTTWKTHDGNTLNITPDTIYSVKHMDTLTSNTSRTLFWSKELNSILGKKGSNHNIDYNWTGLSNRHWPAGDGGSRRFTKKCRKQKRKRTRSRK
jgi:hypothetical protein